MHNFVLTYIGYLENIGSVTYKDVFNVDSLSVNHVNITTDLTGSIKNIGDMLSCFSIECLSVVLGREHYLLIVDRCTSFISKKMSAIYSRLYNQCINHSFK
jgi:hypothetical protein